MPRPFARVAQDFDDDPRKYFQSLASRRAKQALEPPQRIGHDLDRHHVGAVVRRVIKTDNSKVRRIP